MKNLPNAAAGAVAFDPCPLTFVDKQLMMGTMNPCDPGRPVVKSMPATPLAAAQYGAPFSPIAGGIVHIVSQPIARPIVDPAVCDFVSIHLIAA